MSNADSTVHLPLSNSNLFAVIDKEDEALVLQYGWRLQRSSSGQLVAVVARIGKLLALHKLLMNTPKGLVVDHKDGDVLNNTRANLRICTHAENMRNSKLRVNSKSGLRNVQMQNKGGGKKGWRAQVRAHGKLYRKWFPATDEGKLLAYKWAEDLRHELHGAFAYTKCEKKGPQPVKAGG